VRQSLARIKASPFIPRKESMRGFVYQVEDGKLSYQAMAPARSL
jgi:carbonic anhydrase